MGRLVMLLVLAAGLPGILLGTGLAALAFGPPPILPDMAGWTVPGSPVAMAALVLAAIALIATGAIARGRMAAASQ
ncbi:hypothetical protein [Geminicoccus roseus]|uniref:hypothetical protein n=1 Tax=Geminicoccus roseus TaxID=404900 RepID=UPI00040F3684|nr:hypothetical protein [Geminicoccus roseus]